MGRRNIAAVPHTAAGLTSGQAIRTAPSESLRPRVAVRSRAPAFCCAVAPRYGSNGAMAGPGRRPSHGKADRARCVRASHDGTVTARRQQPSKREATSFRAAIPCAGNLACRPRWVLAVGPRMVRPRERERERMVRHSPSGIPLGCSGCIVVAHDSMGVAHGGIVPACRRSPSTCLCGQCVVIFEARPLKLTNQR